MSLQQSLEQKRAAEAWKFVEEIEKFEDGDKGKDIRKKYGSLAHKAPADIQIGGLAQTLAFWKAKSTPKERGKETSENIAHEKILSHISLWVTGKDGMDLGEIDFLNWLVNKAETSQYRRATAETLAFLVWVKRFAESKLPQE
jgi:CRISPR-associated protein Cmr5